jgi:hypothetical protein
VFTQTIPLLLADRDCPVLVPEVGTFALTFLPVFPADGVTGWPGVDADDAETAAGVEADASPDAWGLLLLVGLLVGSVWPIPVEFCECAGTVGLAMVRDSKASRGR